MERLALAMLTYNRPEDLREILPLLVEQARSVADLGVVARVKIVDNDPEGGARSVVEESGLEGVDYINELEPGISAARSRALTEAADDDWLIFIDDDDRPTDGWLRDMVLTARETGATAVAGRVQSVFPDGTDEWIIKGGFFDRRHRWGVPTGAEIVEAATNSLLVDMHFIREKKITFASHLGLTGGEDSMFSRAIVRNGGRMVWCASALILDIVSASRTNKKWVLMRALAYGNGAALVSRTERDSPALRISLVLGGLARVFRGLGQTLFGTVRKDIYCQAQGLRILMRGVGMTLGSAGWAYCQYTRDGKRLVRLKF